MTVTKSDISEDVCARCGYSRKRSSRIVETLLEIITENLVSGDELLVSGFGKFLVKDKNERRGRNPSTGGELMLGARRVVIFRCSPVLREKLNSDG